MYTNLVFYSPVNK